jgi:hypothetical protein
MSGGFAGGVNNMLNDFMKTGRKENFGEMEKALNSLKEMIVRFSLGSAVRPRCQFTFTRQTGLATSTKLGTHLVRFVVFTEDTSKPGLRKMIMQYEEEFDYTQKMQQQMAVSSIHNNVMGDLVRAGLSTINKNTPIAQYFDSGEVEETPEYAL